VVSGIQCAVRGSSAGRIAPPVFFGLADGLSIARAVIEFLHNNPRIAAKTLFATHYHELTDAADYLPRVRNFHLAVEEKDGEVRYLHKVEPGRAEKSFGIYVA
jgi:DNA mismatch repair protein MutS